MTEENNIIVTGGTGVIGAWAVRELALNGYRPYVFTRGSTKIGLPILKDVEDKIDWVTGDIENPWSIVEAVQSIKPKILVHLATVKPWQIDKEFVSNPNPFIGVQNLIVGTTNILEAAKNFGIKRVVFASTKAVYSAFENKHCYPNFTPLKEDHPCVPESMYGLGKLTAERLGEYYKRVFSIDFIALRFATTYGPFKRGSAKHPAGLIQNALTGQKVHLEMDVKTLNEIKDDYVYNRDVGRAIYLACITNSNTQLVYNIGSGVGVTYQELIDTINQVEPNNNIGLVMKENMSEHPFGKNDHSGIFDISAARRDLGYEPKYYLKDGIKDLSTFIQAK